MTDGDVASRERPPQQTGPSNMVWIPGGTFRMGSDKYYPEEAPDRRRSRELLSRSYCPSPSLLPPSYFEPALPFVILSMTPRPK